MKLTEVIRRYNHAWDAHYAEALVNLFRKCGAPLMRLGAVSVIAVMLAVAVSFGFGGRDLARQVLERHLGDKHKQESEKEEEPTPL